MDKRFGINMKEYCRRHEAAMLEALGDESGVTQALLEGHLEKLARIQHERLIHLIVTLMVVITELFAVYAALFRSGAIADMAGGSLIAAMLPSAVMLGLAVLLGFYFYHYFFLENTVQRWYLIADEMHRIIDGKAR